MLTAMTAGWGDLGVAFWICSLDASICSLHICYIGLPCSMVASEQSCYSSSSQRVHKMNSPQASRYYAVF